MPLSWTLGQVLVPSRSQTARRSPLSRWFETIVRGRKTDTLRAMSSVELRRTSPRLVCPSGVVSLLALVAWLLAGCRTPATQIQLFIDTDSPIERPVTVDVFSFNGAVPPSELSTRAAFVSMGSLRLARLNTPMDTFIAGGSIGVVPPTDRGVNTVTLWLRATVAATPTSPAVLIDRAVRVSFVRGRSGTARVFLPLRCGDASVGCVSVDAAQCTVSVRCREQNATCGDLGECVRAEVPVSGTGEDGGVDDVPTSGLDASTGRADTGVPPVDVPSVMDVPNPVDVANGLDIPDPMDVPTGMDGPNRMDVPNGQDVPNAMDVPNRMDVPNAPVDSGVCPMGTVACGMSGCVDLASNNSHCGACGTVCPAGQSCLARSCQCNAGTIRCGALCIDSQTDPNNCGACNNVCPMGQLCVAGACRVGCPAPNTICGAGAMMTCVNLQTDRNNCGVCANVCATANGVPSCAGGACGIGSCNIGFGNCDGMILNGCETATSNAVANCGACGNVCPPPPNASASCTVGVCGLGSCNMGFGNCDLSAANGCEVNTNTNTSNCGSCGTVCSVANATSLCTAGACGIGMCAPNFASCDAIDANGCETDLRSSRQNCGACGNRCPLPMVNGTSACVASTCVLNCDPGYESFNGDCIDAGRFPRPIAPLSLGDVSQRQPTVRWQLPVEFAGAEVQFCQDRACTMVIETRRAVGTSTQPLAALPAGSVVFWRLRGATMAATAATFSPTWLFHVPSVSNGGGVDTSSTPHLDVNGDGYDDVVVGTPQATPGGRMFAGTASVFHGSPGAIPAGAARVLEGVAPLDSFGFSVAGAGDLNGDGFGDLVVGAPDADNGPMMNSGAASIFYGSAAGVSMLPGIVLQGSSATDGFGRSVAGVGDVNGDGYGDLIVGADYASPGGRINAGTASVFHGSAAGPALMANRVLEGLAPGDYFGQSVAGAGDLNGDRFADVVVGAPGANPSGRNNAGTASVYLGTGSGIPVAPATTLAGGVINDALGTSVASAGDVNLDGYSDVIAGAAGADPGGRLNAGTAGVYQGAAGGVGMAPVTLLEGVLANDQFGRSVATAGDTNGDGFSDVIVGADNASPGGRMNAGTASVFAGGPGGILMFPARVLEGIAAGDRLGASVAGAGDVNRDGFADVVVGAWQADPMGLVDAGTVSIFLGAVPGIPMGANRVLPGPAVNSYFGYSVASAGRLERRNWLANYLTNVSMWTCFAL